MRHKRVYYKDHVDRRVRLRKLIYLLILLTAFGFTLYDSFMHTLPFHYILFIFIGRVMAQIIDGTQRVTHKKEDNKYTIEWSVIGIVLVIAVILTRAIVFPRILTELNVIYVSDAILLIVIGWLLGRIQLLSAKIEEVAFSDFLKSRPPKPDLPPENEPIA